jgi:hypothetical protein
MMAPSTAVCGAAYKSVHASSPQPTSHAFALESQLCLRLKNDRQCQQLHARVHQQKRDREASHRPVIWRSLRASSSGMKMSPSCLRTNRKLYWKFLMLRGTSDFSAHAHRRWLGHVSFWHGAADSECLHSVANGGKADKICSMRVLRTLTPTGHSEAFTRLAFGSLFLCPSTGDQVQGWFADDGVRGQRNVRGGQMLSLRTGPHGQSDDRQRYWAPDEE